MNRVIAESIQKGDLNKTWTTSYHYGSVEINTGKGKETVEHVLITKETNPDNWLLAETYVDTLGKTVREKANGLYTDYVYDREGKVTFRCSLGSDPNNAEPVITAYLYDAYGNNTDQILNPTYDTESGAFLVTEDSLTQSMTYDSTGNVLSATDGEGNVTSYTYDENGRVTKAVQPIDSSGEEGVTAVQYDVKNDDGTTSDIITDALGRTSVTTYNSIMQPIQIVDHGDEDTGDIKTAYTYNLKGLLTKETTGLGTAKTYEYDSKDRVTTIHYLDKDGKEELKTCYTYDKSDNITTMKDYKVDNKTVTLYRYTGFTYDRLKRMTELVELNTATEPTEEEIQNNKTIYEYDIDGNLTGVTYPSKNQWNVKGLAYEYDKENKWLRTISVVLDDDTTATLRAYSYNNYGNVSEIKDYRVLSEDGTVVENPEYTTCTYTYDAYLRPVSMTYKDSSEPSVVKESYAYEYDKNSNIIKETLFNNYPTATEDKQNEERTYSYDTDGKLLSMTVNDLLNEAESYTVSYTYDRVGNRLTQEKETAADTETTSYIYNSLNQLLSSVTTNEEGTITEQKSYVYDANGSQITETDSISNTLIESSYDSAGRLSAYKKTENDAVTVTQTNQYNGAGARIQKVEGEEITNYYYSQGSVLYTEDGTGAGTSLNLSGISGNVIATARAEGDEESYYYYHKDPAGSTTNLRDATGESIVSYQYTDFGETTIGGNEDFYNEICYNSGIYDKSTGLYYLNARYYDPADGRFISRDSYRGSVSNPSSLHLYAYCANNPVNYDDPSGHFPLKQIVGAAIGGGIGYFTGKAIAKKAKATGWKKKAIIAGCAIAGAAIGAFATTKMAKDIAKAAVKLTKKRIKNSAAKVLKKSKNIVKKAKPGVVKTVSKTKKIISKANNKTARKFVRDTMISGISEGVSEGLSSKAKGQSFKEGFSSGAKAGLLNGLVTGGVGLKVKDPFLNNAIGGTVTNLWKEIRKGKINGAGVARIVVNTSIQAGAGKAFGTMGDEIDIDNMWESKSITKIIGAFNFEFFGQGITGAYSMAGEAAINVFHKGD